MRSPIIGLAKASHFGPTLIVTLASFFIAELYWPLASSVLIALAIFSGQLIVGWSNDLIDYKDDLAHQRLKKPLVAGLISIPFLRSALTLVIPIALLLNLSGPLGLTAGGLSLFTIGWAIAYNLYFKFNLFSPLPYAIAFGLLPSLIAMSAGEIPPPWMWTTGALFGCAAHFINVIKDMEQDQASGIRGLPQRCGSKVSLVVAVSLLALTAAIVLFSLPLQLSQ
ncbi:MAG: hypothetical protein RIS05_848 [Actinomycetota bacterium]|jgi:4-hydroxybenzoate polyprenyltransferase